MVRESTGRDDQMTFRINEAERAWIVDAAAARNITISDLLRRSLKFYLGFPEGFIEGMEPAAKAFETDVSTMVGRLLMVYIATDNAILDNFKVSRTHKYAFALNDQGALIPVDKIGDFVYGEIDRVCKKTLKKFNRTSETGEDAVLTKEEVMLIPKLKDRAYSEWGVKPEFNVAPVARAKGK